MSDSQKITDSIRAFLAIKERTWNDDLPDLASSYAALCREANDRLRRCADYLRRGLRSEAVHLAECPPDLTEMVRLLHFPQCMEWSQLCSGNGLTVPPALPIDSLTDLEAARRVERELGALLSQHRVLSLAKSPIKDRLEVARELAERDSANLSWREEIRELEAARVEGIRQSAMSAVKARNKQAITEMIGVLSDGSWTHPPPQDLVAELQRVVSAIGLAEKAAVARTVAAELLAAHEKQDYDSAITLRSQWSNASNDLPPPAREAIRLKVDPVLQWIDEEHRRRNPHLQAELLEDLRHQSAAALEEDRPALTQTHFEAESPDPDEESAPVYPPMEPPNPHTRILGIVVGVVVLIVIIALIASHYFPPSGGVPEIRSGR